MAASVEIPSPNHTNKVITSLIMASPSLSPSSDKRFWSNLRNRVDVLLEENSKDHKLITNSPVIAQTVVGESERSKRLKNDSVLLLKGFDSVSHTLSQLSSTLDNALQGVRELAKPPTLSEILHSNLKARQQNEEEEEEEEEESKGKKRKHQSDVEHKEDEERPKESKIMKRAKNIAISMATKANSLARELKSIKSDMSFIQERCGLLEEENKRLRDGFVKGVRPEEDDLVRLQLEVLLEEKARLTNENANLVRENQCLHQMVEYHQMTSQEDLSPSDEQVIQGLCLDFSSPDPQIYGEEGEEEEEETRALDVSKSLNESFEEEEEED